MADRADADAGAAGNGAGGGDSDHHSACKYAKYHALLTFSLRDADSSRSDIFYQLGLLRDDYTPKPAFGVYRELITELGVEDNRVLV